MAPSNSSTKKLAKVARSGKKRSIRESSDRTYPLAILVICIVGTLLVFWGRDQRASAQRLEPRLNADHWHAAMGLYLCDTFAPPPRDVAGDKLGIHTHDDGIAHIHPFSSAAAGENATVGKFYDNVGIKIEGGKLTTPEGKVYESGKTTCPSGEAGKLVLVEWKSADDDTTAPRVIETDINATRFLNDRMAFTLAFVPEAKILDIPRPESIPQLDQLTDVDPNSLGSTTLPGSVPSLPTGSTIVGDPAATTTTASSAPAATGGTVASSTTTTSG